MQARNTFGFKATMITIVPIWFVGMTLYQRIYATKDVKTAQRAWYLAGLLEWPLMAFLGVTLGMFSRILYPAVEAEMGLPTLIRDVMPAGLAGLVMAAYFSAIMSTADSCLLASAGNFTNDIYQKYIRPDAPEKRVLAVSRWVTVALGAASVGLALLLPTVLEMILLSYSFMVSGLFAPTLCGLLFKGGTPKAALWSMAAGGGSAVLFELVSGPDPPVAPILGSLPLSFAVYAAFSWADARSAAKG